MTLAGIITMVLSIGCAWALLIACSTRLLRHDREEQRESDSSQDERDGAS